MRKLILVLICIALVVITGCNSTKQDSPSDVISNVSDAVETQQDFLEQKPVQVQNFLNLDFSELQNTIAETAGTQKTVAAFMYDTHPVDIFFSPTGDVTQCRMCLWTLDSETGGDYVMSEYRVNGIPETASFDVACTKPNLHFAKELFSFDFSGLGKYTSWVSNTDLQALLDTYVPDTPVGYRLVTGVIPAEIIDSQQVSCTALDLSSDAPTEIDLASLPRIPDRYYLEYDLPSEYYALLPYYPLNETLGYTVPLNQPPEGVMDYAAPDAGSYSLNNILLLFPDGVSD